jgi:hypothetical protein
MGLKYRPRLVVAICFLAALLALAAWLGHGRSRQLAAPEEDSFLRDVIEPITIVDSMYFDDGGSVGLRFSDARGTVRDVCLEDRPDWLHNPDVQLHNLVLNSFFYDGEHARHVPIDGPEARALVAILQRWARQDPDARELERRFALYKNGEIDVTAFWAGLTARHHVKETAVKILRDLRAAN